MLQQDLAGGRPCEFSQKALLNPENPFCFQAGPLMDHVLQQDLADDPAGAAPPFLVGRALWLASQ